MKRIFLDAAYKICFISILTCGSLSTSAGTQNSDTTKKLGTRAKLTAKKCIEDFSFALNCGQFAGLESRPYYGRAVQKEACDFHNSEDGFKKAVSEYDTKISLYDTQTKDNGKFEKDTEALRQNNAVMKNRIKAQEDFQEKVKKAIEFAKRAKKQTKDCGEANMQRSKAHKMKLNRMALLERRLAIAKQNDPNSTFVKGLESRIEMEKSKKFSKAVNVIGCTPNYESLEPTEAGYKAYNGTANQSYNYASINYIKSKFEACETYLNQVQTEIEIEIKTDKELIAKNNTYIQKNHISYDQNLPAQMQGITDPHLGVDPAFFPDSTDNFTGKAINNKDLAMNEFSKRPTDTKPIEQIKVTRDTAISEDQYKSPEEVTREEAKKLWDYFTGNKTDDERSPHSDSDPQVFVKADVEGGRFPLETLRFGDENGESTSSNDEAQIATAAEGSTNTSPSRDEETRRGGNDLRENPKPREQEAIADVPPPHKKKDEDPNRRRVDGTKQVADASGGGGKGGGGPAGASQNPTNETGGGGSSGGGNSMAKQALEMASGLAGPAMQAAMQQGGQGGNPPTSLASAGFGPNANFSDNGSLGTTEPGIPTASLLAQLQAPNDDNQTNQVLAEEQKLALLPPNAVNFPGFDPLQGTGANPLNATQDNFGNFAANVGRSGKKRSLSSRRKARTSLSASTFSTGDGFHKRNQPQTLAGNFDDQLGTIISQANGGGGSAVLGDMSSSSQIGGKASGGADPLAGIDADIEKELAELEKILNGEDGGFGSDSDLLATENDPKKKEQLKNAKEVLSGRKPASEAEIHAAEALMRAARARHSKLLYTAVSEHDCGSSDLFFKCIGIRVRFQNQKHMYKYYYPDWVPYSETPDFVRQPRQEQQQLDI